MRDITLQVKSTQKITGEEPIIIDFVTEGKYELKNDATYLIYEESELSGFPGHKTSLKIRESAVDMRRYGESEAHMHFEKGIRETADYETPYGVFKIETLTHRIQVELGDQEGFVEVEYALSIQGMHEAAHTLMIRYW